MPTITLRNSFLSTKYAFSFVFCLAFIYHFSPKLNTNEIHRLYLCSGYTYASVQYGRECWCGNETTSDWFRLDSDGSKCHYGCAGDSQLICGGYWFQNVYSTGNNITHLVFCYNIIIWTLNDIPVQTPPESQVE